MQDEEDEFDDQDAFDDGNTVNLVAAGNSPSNVCFIILYSK